MARSLAFLGILIFHWSLQFLAWSFAERNAFARLLWQILAAPLIYLFDSIANHYFGAIVTANSIIWAMVLTYIIFRFPLSARTARTK